MQVNYRVMQFASNACYVLCISLQGHIQTADAYTREMEIYSLSHIWSKISYQVLNSMWIYDLWRQIKNDF